MLFSCKCLNITIKVQKELVEAASDISLQQLLPNTKGAGVNDNFIAFFKQAIGPFDEVAISEEQKALIHMIAVEDWQLHRCINCKFIAFAIHEINRTYLVNALLRTSSDEIEKVKESNVYSPCFRIVMVQVEFTDLTQSGGKPSYADKPRIRCLQQRMHEAMQEETTAVEERIRLYSEQQYAMLKMQRLRVEQEFNTLCSVINSVPDLLLTTNGGNNGDASPTTTTGETDLGGGANNNNTNGNNKSLMETPPATPDNTPMSIGNSPPIGASNATATGTGASGGGFFKHRIPNKVKNLSFKSNLVNRHSISQGHMLEPSVDADCIFDMDGMTDINPNNANHRSPISNPMSDLEESDQEEDPAQPTEPGAMQIPGQAHLGRRGSVAKSLPMPMPAAMVSYRATDEDFEELPEDNNVDIAASIKALARSVHGEAIFGDLPRPRRPSKFIVDI